MDFDTDLIACARIVEEGDPFRFRTVMAAPVAARAKLFPLYAFNVEVSRAPWVASEPMIAQMRLQWWRDALAEIAAGGIVRRHEVVTPLALVLGAEHVALLDDLIVARHWECYTDPFEDQAALDHYLAQTSGNLMQVAVSLLGGAGPDVDAAQAAGFGLGVANWLRAVPDLEARRRAPLVDGTPEGICKLAKRSLQTLQMPRKRFAKSLLPAFWPATGAGRILRAAIRDPRRVADKRLPAPGGLSFALTAALGRW